MQTVLFLQIIVAFMALVELCKKNDIFAESLAKILSSGWHYANLSRRKTPPGG